MDREEKFQAGPEGRENEGMPPLAIGEEMMLPIMPEEGMPSNQPIPELDEAELFEARKIEELDEEGKLDDIDRRRKIGLRIMKVLLILGYIAMVIFLLNPSQGGEGGSQGGPPPEGTGNPAHGGSSFTPGGSEGMQPTMIMVATKIFFTDGTQAVYFKTIDTPQGKIELYSYTGLKINMKIGEHQFSSDVKVSKNGDLQSSININKDIGEINHIDSIKFIKDGYKTVDFKNIKISNGMAYIPEVIILPEKK